MQAPFENLLSTCAEPELLAVRPMLRPFSSEACAFLDAVSGELMRDREARKFPELTALGYWLRRTSIQRMQGEMKERWKDAVLQPRGTVLHIAPSNVDTIFVYSWAMALLLGNRNIVRLSRRVVPQTEVLLNVIARLLEQPEHGSIAAGTMLVRYAPDPAITSRLSAVCDARVIWGGDATVAEIRRVPLPSTAIEVAFADKQSLALIGAAGWNGLDPADRQRSAEAFCNDAFWFGQMACSSPRAVLWLGDVDAVRNARSDFWSRVAQALDARRFTFEEINYVDKLVAADSLALDLGARREQSPNNDVTRLWVDEPTLSVPHFCGGGLFLESRLDKLDDLAARLTRKIQTVSYAGLDIDTLRAFAAGTVLAGIDRVVPFGHALDFSPVWDGFDLLRIFAREIVLA